MIYIKSLLPNPVGQDAGNEWIKISNDGEAAISVLGWRIKDQGGATYSLSEIDSLQPGETVELGHALTKINLNNSGDSLFLYNKEGLLVDKFGYTDSVEEGEVLFNDSFISKDANQDANVLANVSEAGVINERFINSNFLEVAFLGFLIATLATALFIYLSVNIFKKDD
ncbi:lamin tail domain-containing protein [Patescibacteria group bacterium]|nr:lamin tail domain-containing protein [Patescibacteria group bacterium]